MLPKINGLFRLTRDAELAYSQNGVAVAKLGLASSEKYKDKESTCFIDAVSFGKAGEIITQYAGQKGNQIYLSGRLKLEQWDDKQTGAKRSKHVMQIDDFDFVSGGQNNGQSQGQQQPQSQQQQGFSGGQNQGQPAQQPVQNPVQQQAGNFQQPTPNDFDDDVPFRWQTKWPELFLLA